MNRVAIIITLLFISLTPAVLKGQSAVVQFPVEAFLNEVLDDYPFSPDNRFKLAAFAELKGEFSEFPKGVILHFSGLGDLSIYEKNCLLKLPYGGVYHLNAGDMASPQGAAMNNMLTQMFDGVILLGNHHAAQDHIEFVDEYLARKNLEPFYKLFVRHILIKYGRFDRQYQRVEFDTDWLPDQTYAESGPEAQIVKKHVSRLLLKLDKTILRGYYLESGGTVYIEDVKRKVKYATGEQYDYNIAAFKLFAQNLFVQTAQIMAKEEEGRLASITSDDLFIGDLVSAQPVLAQTITVKPVVPTHIEYIRPETSRPASISLAALRQVEPLYQPDGWIPMMLSILRSHRVSVADPDVLPYLIQQPFFEKLYQQLTPQERQAVDRTPLGRKAHHF